MPRRKEPRISDTVLDQLLSGADPKTAFDPNRSAMTTASCFQRGPRCQGGRPSGANRSATISGRVRSSGSQKGAGAGLHASPLEEDGFEPSVPLTRYAGLFRERGSYETSHLPARS